jgi:hypothetical protein
MMHETAPWDAETLAVVQKQLVEHNQELGVSDEVAADLGYPIAADDVPRPIMSVETLPEWRLSQETIDLGLDRLPGVRTALQVGINSGHTREAA